jgi:TonB family protein
VSGTVIVGVAIDADGRVQTARIAQSVPLLDDAALDAVRQWEFAPPVVDGKPVPTGVNVAIGFVLGPGGDVPVPSVPSPRPLWLPEDFAFEYTFSCRTRGGSASIDMQQYTAGESARIEFSTDEIQSIYMRMFAAGAFAVPATSWRPEPGVRTAPDGFRLQVRAKPPARESAASPFRNRLDVRHYGVWRRVEWLVSDDGGRPEADDQLETIGGLIREIAAQKPDVRELPADQRQCLAE